MLLLLRILIRIRPAKAPASGFHPRGALKTHLQSYILQDSSGLINMELWLSHVFSTK